jgi:hypothetical protein
MLVGVFVLFAFVSALAAQDAAAQSSCRQVDGNWSGMMGGVNVQSNGSTRAVVRNCQVDWTLPDGSTNRCEFTQRGGQWEYACSRGSRGTVDVSANRLRWRNAFTGNNYVVTVARGTSNQ